MMNERKPSVLHRSKEWATFGNAIHSATMYAWKIQFNTTKGRRRDVTQAPLNLILAPVSTKPHNGLPPLFSKEAYFCEQTIIYL